MKKALLQIHVAVFLWGFTGVLGRAITLDAPILVWYRMLMTALLLLVILSYRKEWVEVAKADKRKLALVGFLMAIHWVAFYGAIKASNASIALVCLSTAAIFASFFNVLINRTAYNYKELALGLLALVGMYLIYRFQEVYAWGITLGIIAAILSALFTVINKNIAGKYPARQIVFYEMGTGLAFITLLMPLQFFFVAHTRVLPSWEDFGWLIILSLCCTVWAQSLALNALKHISSFTATLSVNMEPVYGILLAFLLYKENHELHPGFFIGMGLILLSVILQMLSIVRPGKAAPSIIEEKSGID